MVQCALCYEIGFGVARNPTRAVILLHDCIFCRMDLHKQIKWIKSTSYGQEHDRGIYQSLIRRGLIQPLDLTEGYRGQLNLGTIKRQYQAEISDITAALSHEHHAVVILKSQLSSTLLNHGHLREAEKLYLETLDIATKYLGKEHLITSVITCNLASAYNEMGRFEEAEKLQRQECEMNRRVFGEQHPQTLTCIGGLAGTLREQGRWREAESLELEVNNGRLKLFGDRHYATLAGMNSLATTLLESATTGLSNLSRVRLSEAERLYSQVVERSKFGYGAEHPFTLKCSCNLATTLWEQGRDKEAEQLELEIFGTKRKINGEDHPSTLASLNNLATT